MWNVIILHVAIPKVSQNALTIREPYQQKATFKYRDLFKYNTPRYKKLLKFASINLMMRKMTASLNIKTPHEDIQHNDT